MVIFDLFSANLIQGLILSLVAIGAMIPFRILNFPDLSAEGSYPLGAVICTFLLLSGLDPISSTLIAFLVSGVMGICTAVINLRLKINSLLSGIIISTMIYSINLRILKKPNVSLFNKETIFSIIPNSSTWQIIMLLFIIFIIIASLLSFLMTEKGLCMRAVGENSKFASSQGISKSNYTLIGLFIGNAICGLSGAIMTQMQLYCDIRMGVGIVIHGLAGLMLGEVITGTSTLTRRILAPLVGGIIYQQVQGICISAGLAPSDLKLLTGTVILLVVGIKRINIS